MPTRPFDHLLRFTGALLLLGLLLTLLVPSMGSRSGPRELTASAEIKLLQNALSAFQTRFGALPPSHVILREQPVSHPYDLEGTDAHASIDRTTVSCFRKVWPEFPILTCLTEGIDAGPDGNDRVDFNGNGRVDEELELDGAECLVFFLGGLFRDGSMIGFDANPRNPFDTGHPRVRPLFEFDCDRLIDRDGDGFPEYLDPKPGQSVPYQFFSWGGRAGYRLHVPEKTSRND